MINANTSKKGQTRTQKKKTQQVQQTKLYNSRHETNSGTNIEPVADNGGR